MAPKDPDTLEPQSQGLKGLMRDETGAVTLEWALLLCAIALPSWYIIKMCLVALIGHYQMMTMLNSLPFP
jgi:hypothetical protein